MAFIFPNIDPVIFQLGDTPLRVTWYSLSYIVGILLGLSYLKYLNKTGKVRPPLEVKTLDDLLTAIILGIVIGGRLGYVIFYDLEYNLAHPLNIIRTWEGGMSFHGGLLGVIIAVLINCHIYKVKYFQVMDLLACATPIGLFFGRIANFINAELYGRITDSPLGMIFPGQTTARHASQLYESALEGLVLFTILFIFFKKTKAQTFHGMLSGIFLLGYAFFRSLIENYREPDAHIGFIFGNFTMGKLLSLPMIVLGIVIILYSLACKKNESN
jgi:phosphatidylglycerol:prolipoprotein diacylglycerol transferase